MTSLSPRSSLSHKRNTWLVATSDTGATRERACEATSCSVSKTEIRASGRGVHISSFTHYARTSHQRVVDYFVGNCVAYDSAHESLCFDAPG